MREFEPLKLVIDNYLPARSAGADGGQPHHLVRTGRPTGAGVRMEASTVTNIRHWRKRSAHIECARSYAAHVKFSGATAGLADLIPTFPRSWCPPDQLVCLAYK